MKNLSKILLIVTILNIFHPLLEGADDGKPLLIASKGQENNSVFINVKEQIKKHPVLAIIAGMSAMVLGGIGLKYSHEEYKKYSNRHKHAKLYQSISNLELQALKKGLRIEEKDIKELNKIDIDYLTELISKLNRVCDKLGFMNSESRESSTLVFNDKYISTLPYNIYSRLKKSHTNSAEDRSVLISSYKKNIEAVVNYLKNEFNRIKNNAPWDNTENLVSFYQNIEAAEAYLGVL